MRRFGHQAELGALVVDRERVAQHLAALPRAALVVEDRYSGSRRLLPRPHISPALTDHVRFHGTYAFDIDRELAELDPSGYRPLRRPNPDGDDHALR